MLWLYVTVLVSSVLLAQSQFDAAKPKCCAPKQYEGNFCEVSGGVAHHHPFHFADYSKLSYDFPGKRIAVDVHYVSRRHKGEVKVILNFKQKKLYYIHGKKCVIRPLKKAIKLGCIPGSAKKLGDTFLGAGSNKLPISTYRIAKKKVYAVLVTVTSKGCIPIHETLFARFKHGKLFKNISFFGITNGIKDPKVFVPPASCKKAEEEIEDEQNTVLRVKSKADELVDYVIEKFSE